MELPNSAEVVEGFLKGLDMRYERENLSLGRVENFEIRLFNYTTGEQTVRLEFIGGALTRIDYWDLTAKTIETITWDQPSPAP